MKPAIPSPAGSSDERVLRPVKETLDILTGARSGELAELPTTATLDDVIAKVNALINRLNRSGD
jgi:hypothetical protein